MVRLGEMSFCLYLSTCIVSGKRYVGITGREPASRWQEHRASARRGSAITFHRAIRKYGEGSFRFEVLTTGLSKEDASLGEQQAIRYFQSKSPRGYNRTDGGATSCGGMTGRTHSAETRAKISASNIGHIASPETRAKLSEATSRRWSKQKASRPSVKPVRIQKQRGRKGWLGI